jgi:hypothetical protein
MSTQFFGKYRGVVVNNMDPMHLGRIQAKVPDVIGVGTSNWALPAVPCSLPKRVGSALPKIGASVWIEFEQGNPDCPIWTGCYFGRPEDTPPSLRTAR